MEKKVLLFSRFIGKKHVLSKIFFKNFGVKPILSLIYFIYAESKIGPIEIVLSFVRPLCQSVRPSPISQTP
jgi:hypothetical protein